MRHLLRRKSFWATVVAIVIPFGWLFLLVRLAARAIGR